jgi:hypothetical protein
MIAMVSLLEEISFGFGNSYKTNPERFKPLLEPSLTWENHIFLNKYFSNGSYNRNNI